MAELSPIPFAELVRRMRREVAASEAIFDLPVRKWFVPDALDFSTVHFGRRAATAVGPAAGPHTQLAQNVVLSWLAGGRILELKTVQVNDRLVIPRPCIHVPNVGFNVEWSQELRVEQSQLEYAKAVYLIEILKATRGFGVFGDGASTAGFDTIYDISVGYDLAGIRSDKVTGFLEALRRPAPTFDALRRELTGDLREFRDLELPASISECVTLSTFHGCPAGEIEAISRYLIEERGLHTIVKLNPTLLGFEAVRELLHDRLGYEHLELDRAAFDADLAYDDALAILRRLRGVAAAHGSEVGAKFTNTLVVRNRADYFPTQADPYMYLSGPPLHVISMNLMQRLRDDLACDDLGFELPTSFSAGVDARNFPAAVACGMVPITTCTDLLRQGGYGRLPPYLRALGKEMRRLGVTSREAYVLAAGGHAAEAVRASVERLPGGAELWRREGERLASAPAGELPRLLRELGGDALVLDATRAAGRLNGRDLVPGLAEDPRYHARANAKPPRRIDSRLDLYDCINCDLCIAACPNDAIFAYEARPLDVATVRLGTDAPGRGFKIAEAHQLAVAEGACNSCSNCEVYCPEDGAPFLVKEQVFLGREAFEASSADGFFRDGGVLHARLEGRELRLEPSPERDRAVLRVADGLDLELTWETLSVVRKLSGNGSGVELDSALVWRMKTVWESIYHAPRPNPVHRVEGA
jgi:putative selenate reductase